MTTRVRCTAAVALLVLAGCAGGESGSGSSTGTVTLDAEPTSEASGTPVEPDPSPRRAGPPPIRAAGVAEQAVPGGTVVAVDGESDLAGRWGVSVVRADGVLVVLQTSPDGGEVVEEPVAGGSFDGSDDLGEVAGRVGEVRVFATEALRSAARTAPEGEVVALELQEEDDALVWQVDLRGGGGVSIDAVTGVSAADD